MERNDTKVIPQFSVGRSLAPSSKSSSSGDEMMYNFCHEAVPGGRECQGIRAKRQLGPGSKKGLDRCRNGPEGASHIGA